MQLVLDVPEQLVLEKDPADFVDKVRLYAALMMFEAGELSAGAACEFANVDRFTFAGECKRHGIPVIDYTIEEVEAELESLRNDR